MAEQTAEDAMKLPEECGDANEKSADGHDRDGAPPERDACRSIAQ
jgi:hypothetical protein